MVHLGDHAWSKNMLRYFRLGARNRIKGGVEINL